MRALISTQPNMIESELSSIKRNNITLKSHEKSKYGLIVTFSETEYKKFKRYSERKRNVFIERTDIKCS